MSTAAFLDIVRPDLERVEATLHDVVHVDYPSAGQHPAAISSAGAASGCGRPSSSWRPALAPTIAGEAHRPGRGRGDDPHRHPGARRPDRQLPAAPGQPHGEHPLARRYRGAGGRLPLRQGRRAGIRRWSGVRHRQDSSPRPWRSSREGELRQAFTARSVQAAEEHYYQWIYAKTASLFAASARPAPS